MRVTRIVILLALGLAGLATGGEVDSKSAEYLKKLNEFEVEKVTAVKKEIWHKRVQVAGALKRELTAATKKGDLDTANALKAEIDRLAGKVDLAAIAPVTGSGKSEPVSKKDLEKGIVGQKWKDQNGRTYLFERRGKLAYGEPGKEGEEGIWEWEAEKSGTVTITSTSNSSNVITFAFTSDKEGTKVYSKNGEAGDATPITLVE